MTRSLSIATKGMVSDGNRPEGVTLGTKGVIFFRRSGIVGSKFVYLDLTIKRQHDIDLHITREKKFDVFVERMRTFDAIITRQRRIDLIIKREDFRELNI